MMPMIKIGKDIKNIKIGKKDISKVYKGGNLIWSNFKQWSDYFFYPISFDKDSITFSNTLPEEIIMENVSKIVIEYWNADNYSMGGKKEINLNYIYRLGRSSINFTTSLGSILNATYEIDGRVTIYYK